MTQRGVAFEDLRVGMSASLTREVGERDIALFGEVSGDMNPAHFDEAYAKTTIFKTRIAHGMLSAAYFSAILGMQLPGPGTIYMSQTLRFKAPVKLGETVTATLTITEIIPDKRRVVLSCEARVGELVVVQGEALVMVP